MNAIVSLLGLLVVAVAACSTSDSMPADFSGMASDEVGCTVQYGSDSLYVVGPLGPSDSENVEPNGATLIRIGRTASDVIVRTEFPDSGSNGGAALNEITTEGVVVDLGSFRNGGEPGYQVTCWRGDA